MKAVPSSLKTWFNIHIVADLIFGIPSFLFPTKFLMFLGWNPIDPAATRLVGAALIGIAALSYYCNKSNNLEVFRVALKFKSVWGSLALLASLYTAITGGPKFAWVAAGIFLVFAVVWNYFRIKLK